MAPGNLLLLDKPRPEFQVIQLLLPDSENALYSRSVCSPLRYLQLLFESGNPVFHFSSLLVRFLKLCIPTQHGTPPPPQCRILLQAA